MSSPYADHAALFILHPGSNDAQVKLVVRLDALDQALVEVIDRTSQSAYLQTESYGLPAGYAIDGWGVGWFMVASSARKFTSSPDPKHGNNLDAYHRLTESPYFCLEFSKRRGRTPPSLDKVMAALPSIVDIIIMSAKARAEAETKRKAKQRADTVARFRTETAKEAATDAWREAYTQAGEGPEYKTLVEMAAGMRRTMATAIRDVEVKERGSSLFDEVKLNHDQKRILAHHGLTETEIAELEADIQVDAMALFCGPVPTSVSQFGIILR